MTEADRPLPRRPAGRTPPPLPGDPAQRDAGPQSPRDAGPQSPRAAGPQSLRDAGPYSRHLPVMALAAATAIAILGYSVIAVMLLEREAPPQPRSAPPVFVLPLVSPPVSVEPSPARSVAPKDPRRLRDVSTGAPRPPSRDATAPGRQPTNPSPSPSPTPEPAFAAGQTIGLGFPARPGHRVQHRDHLARIEPVTPSSSASDRLATRFVVEAGLADSRCVSFASVERPGFYLRHRNFFLRLDAAEPSTLFQNDATFCPTPIGGGFALRSANYPRHHLVRDDGLLRLISSEPGRATLFRALSPL